MTSKNFECRECGSSDIYVLETRKDTSPIVPGVIRRRRQCANCMTRFSTFEISKEDWRLLKAVHMTIEARYNG